MAHLARNLIIRLHLTVAAVFLPLGLVFLITGVSFILDIDDNSTSRVYNIEPDIPLEPNVVKLTTLARAQLMANGYSIPRREPKLKRKDAPYYLEWKGLKFKATLKPTANTQVAELKVVEYGWLGQLMQVHKSAGGILLKSVALLWALGLLILFISGTYLALKTPKLRKPALISLACGSCIMVILIVAN